MELKYKEDIENALIDSPLCIDVEAFDELDEVYSKAKAFDRIKIISNKYANDLSMSAVKSLDMIDGVLEGK